MRGWIKEIETPEQLKLDYPELWAESVRLLPSLSDDERAKAITLVVATCPYCFRAGIRCQCWDDE